MGIEPTEPTLNAGSNGFEDRGRHQAYKHFPIEILESATISGFEAEQAEFRPAYVAATVAMGHIH